MFQEGVVFAISGIQNPARGLFRTQGLEMGAQYRPDWTSDCTVLVCAFKDTPKFKQVRADGGTIVSKVSWRLFPHFFSVPIHLFIISNTFAELFLVNLEISACIILVVVKML